MPATAAVDFRPPRRLFRGMKKSFDPRQLWGACSNRATWRAIAERWLLKGHTPKLPWLQNILMRRSCVLWRFYRHF